MSEYKRTPVPRISHEEMPNEHGTVQAYITGFVLSLVFTLIPYFMVTHHVTSNKTLLAVILGFGVLQMLVQLLFFLHLGRKPRPGWQIIFLVWTVASVLIVIGGSIIITTNLHHNMTPSDQVKKLTNDEGIYQVDGKLTGACEGIHTNHIVKLETGNVTPFQTTASKCDTLTFMNDSTDTIEITYGEHPEHKSYAGVNEYIIRKGQNKTITLSETGTYKFHDHLQPETAGTFIVAE